MDFGKKYVDVFTTWTDLQVKTGQGWVKAIQGVDKFDPSLVWDKTIDAYQASIQGTLDAEVASIRLWFEDVAGVKGLPEEALKLAEYSKDFTVQFTNAQQSVIDSGFKFLRQIDVNRFAIELPQKQPVKEAAKAKA